MQFHLDKQCIDLCNDACLCGWLAVLCGRMYVLNIRLVVLTLFFQFLFVVCIVFILLFFVICHSVVRITYYSQCVLYIFRDHGLKMGSQSQQKTYTVSFFIHLSPSCKVLSLI